MKTEAYTVAVVQQPSVFFDREETLRRAVSYIDEAVSGGARLIVFPETFVPGYPDWVWHIAPENAPVQSALFSKLLANSVDLDAGDLAPMQKAASRHGVTIVCGVDERNAEASRTTIFNTLVTIGPDGSIFNKHRKLMPTYPERLVWGIGDGSGLRVVDTPSGRLGALICWENYMPLARYAIYAQGVEIYVASTWDEGPVWTATMQHIAAEARCWVIGSGSGIHTDDVPADLPYRSEIYPESGWINPGDSVIVSPSGKIIAGPMHEAKGILYADCDPAVARAARRTLDTAGHYSRPDVFELRVNRRRNKPAEFSDDVVSAAPAVTDAI